MKKIIAAVLSAVVLVGLYFLLSALFPMEKPYKLTAPVEVALNGYTLSWSYDKAADGYVVTVDGQQRRTATNSINLKYSDNGKSACVRAVSESEKIEDSDNSEPFTIMYSEYTEKYFDFVIYRIDKIDYYKKEFIYNGGLISVASPDVSFSGYVFNGWFTYENGVKKPLTQSVVSDSSLILYGDISAVNYKITYAAEGFIIPEESPKTYNVENYTDVLKVTAQSKGYKINGWFSDKEKTRLFGGSGNPPVGDVTLYPNVVLINDGLSFEKTERGYMVSEVHGESGVINVPAEYKGEKVVGVKSKAFFYSSDGTDAAYKSNITKIVFWSENLTLQQNSIGCLPLLNEVIFYGDVEAEKGSIVLLDFEEQAVQIRFIGKPVVESGFVKAALGYLSEGRAEVFVKNEYCFIIPKGEYSIKII